MEQTYRNRGDGGASKMFGLGKVNGSNKDHWSEFLMAGDVGALLA